MRRGWVPPLAVVALLAAGCVGLPLPDAGNHLSGLHSWAIQLEGMERPGAVDRLSTSSADLVVIDRLSTIGNRPDYPMKAVVRQLRASPGASKPKKLCLAYINVGQAESYRGYWQSLWRAPQDGNRGDPPFLLAPDPDGWAANFTVAFWDPAWQSILHADEGSLVDGALDEGFDGVMLDWVAAWEDPAAVAAAAEAGVEPAAAMSGLIRELAGRARSRRPDFIVLLNGGDSLLLRDPGLAEVVDGVVRESLSFAGKASSRWDDPKNADVPATDTDRVAGRLLELARQGIEVLTLDYATTEGNRRAAEKRSRELGFIPCVTRTPLDRVPRR